jgi:hypothetical protein
MNILLVLKKLSLNSLKILKELKLEFHLAEKIKLKPLNLRLPQVALLLELL